MLPGLQLGGREWPVNTRDPVNKQYLLNYGRLAWWLCLPTRAGGRQWHDLMGLYPVTLNNPTAATGFRGTTRPGGFGHFLNDTVGNPFLQTPWAINGRGSANGTSRSVAVWGKPAVTSERGLVAPGDSPNDYASGVPLWTIKVHSDGKWAVWHGAAYRTTTTTVVANVWYRICYTFNAVTTDVGVYVNGKREHTSSAADGPSGTWSNKYLFLGSAYPTAFTGALDDVTVWTRALSAADVWADYNLSRAGYPGVLNRLTPPSAVAAPSIANRRRRVLLCAGGG